MVSILLTTCLVALGLGNADDPVCQARLEVQRTGDTVTITGHCRSTAADATRWSYELHTDKQGRSGSARNAQSGRFVAAPGQDVVLARTTLNLTAHDVCRLQLRVRDEQGRVLATDSLRLPAIP